MTNKEAVEILKCLIPPETQAIELAINVLENRCAKDAQEERQDGEFTIDELEKWLCAVADHNNDDFGKDCLEIVERLDGFKYFVADMRDKENENND